MQKTSEHKAALAELRQNLAQLEDSLAGAPDPEQLEKEGNHKDAADWRSAIAGLEYGIKSIREVLRERGAL